MEIKILLTAINAKFIHSNPAIYSLRAYADRECRQYIDIAEYTINNRKEEILADIYRRKPSIIAFSCYIWNWSMTVSLLNDLPKVLPDVDIWLGGPEVSCEADEIMQKYPMVKGVMIGEGEETFRDIVRYYCSRNGESEGAVVSSPDEIRGLVYRSEDTPFSICHTPERELTDISSIPFLYENLQPFENRIIYYESSRGCPYRCSYCLSSIDKAVRFRDMEMVKKELRFFLENRVAQVKFVDRTFNCNKKHALEIWRYILENDNGVTNFHFEIAGDIITDEELELIGKMRPGLMQFEIGVQTVNADTLKEIRRVSDIEKLRTTVERILSKNNVHVHLDLIAGLPFEDYESFINSFNAVYAMKPHQLQLGFLKVLKGSYMYEKAAEYEIRYTDEPPYEVLSTRWLPYDRLLKLKQVEEMLELYYNSSQFCYTLPVLQTAFEDAFDMYCKLADFYLEKGYLSSTPSRNYRYQALLDFAEDAADGIEEEMMREVLTFDLYLRENIKSRPEFAKDLSGYKPLIKDIYRKEEKDRLRLPAYSAYDARQLSKMTHIEVFDYPVWEDDVSNRVKKLDEPCMVLFDYKEKNPITQDAGYIIIRKEEFAADE